MTHRMVVGALTVVTLCITTNVAAQDKATIERGMKVYEQQKCSLCHSIEGKGNKAGALDGVGSKLTADEIRQWLVKPAEMTAKTKATRKPPMKAYASLPEEDIAALVAYLESLKKK